MHFEIYNEDGRWHWKLVDEGGRDYARSIEEGYISEHACCDAIDAVKRGSPNAYTEF